jgi:hypothetical protein
LISFARCRGPLIVLLGLAIALAVADQLMKVTLGSTARWLAGDEYPADRRVVAHAGERLAGIVGKGKEPGQVGLLLGQSTLECGIDPALLDAEADLPLRWLNLYGVGGSINKIDDIAELVFAGGLKPEVVVFAINPYMLVGIDYDRVRTSERASTGNWIKPWVWTLENRVVFNHVVQTAIHQARLAMIKASGQGIDAMYPAAADPWSVIYPRDKRHSDATQLRWRLDYNRSIGWLDPASYKVTNFNETTLVKLIRRFRDEGTKVVIVLMPERSIFREAIPSEALDCLATINRDAFADRPVPVVSLVDQVPDTLFLDLDHLDREGRAQCSKLVARHVHELLSGETIPKAQGPNQTQ